MKKGPRKCIAGIFPYFARCRIRMRLIRRNVQSCLPLFCSSGPSLFIHWKKCFNMMMCSFFFCFVRCYLYSFFCFWYSGCNCNHVACVHFLKNCQYYIQLSSYWIKLQINGTFFIYVEFLYTEQLNQDECGFLFQLKLQPHSL